MSFVHAYRRRLLLTFAMIFIALFLSALITHTVAANTVFFGRYIQKQVPHNSDEEIYLKKYCEFQDGETIVGGVRYGVRDSGYYKDAPIEWYVIKDEGNSLVLLSRYILANCNFRDLSGGMYVFWDKSVLRKFLNNDFYNKAFTSSEQAQIIPTTVSTEEYTYESIYIDGDQKSTKITTTDKVFALSKEEIREGDYSFGGGILRGIPSPYLNTEGAPSNWYLRGPCDWNSGNQTILFVDANENIDWWYGTYTYGVRPCIRVSKTASGLSAQDPGTTVPEVINKKKTYVIKYNANGGKNAPKAQTIKAGMAVSLSSKKPTRKGYIFKGWATKKKGRVKYAPKDSFTGTKNITLYAVWKKKPKIYVLLMAGSCNFESFFADNLWMRGMPIGLPVSWTGRILNYYKDDKKFKLESVREDIGKALMPATSTVKDVGKLKKIFKSMRLTGYEKPDVKIVKAKEYFTNKKITDTISAYFKKAKSDDLCYFAYCGHGQLLKNEKTGEEFPVGLSTMNKKGFTYYSYSRLIDTLNLSCKGKVFMFLPVCHSGGFADYAREKEYNKITVFPACLPEETTGNTTNIGYETIKMYTGIDTSASDYVYIMYKGFKTPKKMDSGKKDRKITVREFADYMKKKLNSIPTPVHPDYWAGGNEEQVIFEY